MTDDPRPDGCPQASDDDLAAYAVGALEAPAAERLELHLQSCERCRAHLRWLEPAVATLPASVERRAPPPGLRRRVLAEVNADVRRARKEGGARSAVLSRRFRVSLAGAGAALAVALAAIVVVDGDDGRTTIRAKATPAAPSGAVSATLEREGDAGILRVERLPRLQPDRVYQVWVSRGKTLEPSSLFVLRRDGTAEAAVPGPLDGADAVLVTEEPVGGSETPTAPPLLEARLG